MGKAGRAESGTGAFPDARVMRAAIALLLLVALFWAGGGVAGRAAAGNVAPVAMSFWRWTLAFLIFLPFGIRPLLRERSVALRHWRLLALLSFLGIFSFSVLYYFALHYTEAINVALLNSTGPVWILIAALIVHGSPITRRQQLGIVAALAGGAVIVFRGDLGQIGELRIQPGDPFMLGALWLWAAYTVALKWVPRALHPLALMTVLSGLAIPMHLPFYLWELDRVGGFALETRNLVIIVYPAVFASVLAFICYNRAVAMIGANLASFTQYPIPIFTALLAVPILGEAIRPFHLVGLACVFAGVWLATSRPRRQAPSSSP